MGVGIGIGNPRVGVEGTLGTQHLVLGSEKTHHIKPDTCRVTGFYENLGLVWGKRLED